MDAKSFVVAATSGRLIYLRGKVDDKMIDHFLKLGHVFRDAQEHPVVIVVTTRGGSIEDGLAIYNMINIIAKNQPVWMVASVTVRSMGVALMMAVPREQRLAFPGTTIYNHYARMGYKLESEGGLDDHRYHLAEYQASIDHHANERERPVELVIEGTGTSRKKILALYNKPRTIYPPEAVKLGFISGIIE